MPRESASLVRARNNLILRYCGRQQVRNPCVCARASVQARIILANFLRGNRCQRRALPLTQLRRARDLREGEWGLFFPRRTAFFFASRAKMKNAIPITIRNRYVPEMPRPSGKVGTHREYARKVTCYGGGTFVQNVPVQVWRIFRNGS